jgi:hypothetical protein
MIELEARRAILQSQPQGQRPFKKNDAIRFPYGSGHTSGIVEEVYQKHGMLDVLIEFDFSQVERVRLPATGL